MSYIGNVKIDSNNAVPIGSSLYGTCDTAADKETKEVSLSNFDFLLDGVTVRVKFDNSNTHSAPKLKVGDTAAHPIKKYGTTAPGNTPLKSWYAGEVVSFTYSSSTWYMNDARDIPSVTQQTVLSGITVTPGTDSSFTVVNNTLNITSGTVPTVTPIEVNIGSAEINS